jgi:hypothetical protein
MILRLFKSFLKFKLPVLIKEASTLDVIRFVVGGVEGESMRPWVFEVGPGAPRYISGLVTSLYMVLRKKSLD